MLSCHVSTKFALPPLKVIDQSKFPPSVQFIHFASSQESSFGFSQSWRHHHHHHHHHHYHHHHHHLDFHNLDIIEINVIHILTPRGFPVDFFKFRAASTLFFPFLQLLLHQSGLQSTLVLSEIKDTYNQLVFAINTRGWNIGKDKSFDKVVQSSHWPSCSTWQLFPSRHQSFNHRGLSFAITN